MQYNQTQKRFQINGAFRKAGTAGSSYSFILSCEARDADAIGQIYQKRGVLYLAHGLWATQKARADLRMRMLLYAKMYFTTDQIGPRNR
jgi:hypothetical protein